MWHKTLGKIDARWLLVGFALLLIGGTWTLTLYQLSEAKRLQVDDARRDAAALVRLFSEHATRTLEAADQAVIFLRHRYNSLGLQLDINRELREGLGPSDLYNLFTIVDQHADVVLSSQRFQPLNLADREHIRVHMRGEVEQLYISQPVLGRVSRRWSLQLTRRINGPGGAFGGVVVASLDPGYFTRLYHDIDVGRYGSIALAGADGVMRVRRVGTDDRLGQDISASPVFAAMRARPYGTMMHTGPIDGRLRIYAYQKLDRFPLYALVGIDLEERLARYAAGQTRALTLAGAVTLLILGCSAAIGMLVERLVRSRERAVAANLAKSRFLSNISHELRTPLNGILGYAELLQAEFSGAREAGFAAAIERCGRRLLGLIEAVLELSALEAGRTRLDPQPASLAALVQQAVAGHRSVLQARRVGLELALEGLLPEQVRCDRAKLLRVLDILLCNAVDATEHGAVRLAVRMGRHGDLCFEVSDTGAGVPPAQRERIFEKFAQADETATRDKDGAGLGLAIAAQLVELMRGRIWLQDSSGPGAVFVLSLPLEIIHPAAPAMEPA